MQFCPFGILCSGSRILLHHLHEIWSEQPNTFVKSYSLAQISKLSVWRHHRSSAVCKSLSKSRSEINHASFTYPPCRNLPLPTGCVITHSSCCYRSLTDWVQAVAECTADSQWSIQKCMFYTSVWCQTWCHIWY